MYDDHEHDLDQPAEGSIFTPIFLGCGAMGLGCLFSGGLIAVALAIFAPGLIDAIRNIEDPAATEVLALIEAHPDVVAALGSPITLEIDDADIDDTNIDDADITVQLGDEVLVTLTYNLEGPIASGRADVERLQAMDLSGDYELRSVVVTLPDFREIRVYPSQNETPPTPQQLAPPSELAPDVVPNDEDDAANTPQTKGSPAP